MTDHERIRGSCLCGGVKFEISGDYGSFELCHCTRCRKLSGSAFAAMLEVQVSHFRYLQGSELIERYEAPILRQPPAYVATFCRRCGSPVPVVEENDRCIEIPAGLLEGDPKVKPDRHIFSHLAADWYEFTDNLPRPDLRELLELRQARSRSQTPDDGTN